MPGLQSKRRAKGFPSFDLDSRFGKCPVCSAYVPRGQTLCSPRCMRQGYGKLASVSKGGSQSAEPVKIDLRDRFADIPEAVVPEQEHGESCKCEPCPYDLAELFPGATIFYEDQAFVGTRCGWHREVHATTGNVRVCIGGDETLYLTAGKDSWFAVDVPMASLGLLRRSYKWR